MTTLSTEPKNISNTPLKLGFYIALVLALAWAWKGAEMNPGLLIKDAGNMWVLINDFFPPNFADWDLYIEEMVVTVQIAIWGTLLAIVASVPLGILSSQISFPRGFISRLDVLWMQHGRSTNWCSP